LQRRTDHWRGVAIAACEQCGRNRVPLVEPGVSFEAACQGEDVAGELRLMLLPQARDSLAALTPGLRAATLLVGPEGGLSNREQLLAQRGGFRACRLGPRILRAETAPLAALAALQAMAGDLA
jgi:16S rRNA (uracil1498-N3)-methyltransferase